MAISRNRIDTDMNTELAGAAQQLSEFLSEHATQAFSLRELSRAMRAPDLGEGSKSVPLVIEYLTTRSATDPGAQKWRRLLLALMRLEATGRVRERWVDGCTRYTWNPDADIPERRSP